MFSLNYKTALFATVFALAMHSSAWPDTLIPTQGQYWRWQAPSGWTHSESIVGLTLTSPDERYSAALAGMMRSPGSTTPANFLIRMLGGAYPNVRIGQAWQLPDAQTGYQTWHWIEAEVTAMDTNGKPVMGIWKCGVSNYYSLNDGLLVGFWSPIADFQRAKAWLAPIAQSITLTNPNTVFGNNEIIQPRNNPNSAGDSIMRSWESKNRSQDRTNQNWSNVMRGYEPTYDPATGNRYSSPINSWDATRGGYVNPNRPNELLECGTPQDPHPCGR